MPKKSTSQLIKETEQYIGFLEKALASPNFRKNESKEKQEEYKDKLKKAKFRLKVLKT